MATANIGLSSNGSRKPLPKDCTLTSLPAATMPLPMIAPVNACVVETGNPVSAAAMTVAPAPSATASRKCSEPTIWSGTRPFPENLVSSFCAKNMETIDPPDVVTVAHAMAMR